MSVLDVINLQNNGPYLPGDIQLAEKEFASIREELGFSANGKTRLLKLGGNQKIGEEALTLSLTAGAKADSGLCVNSSTCEDICVVNESIRGQWSIVRNARLSMTKLLLSDPHSFGALLKRDLIAYEKKGINYARLNVNSDVAWEKVFPWIADFNIKFYDYTKVLSRVSGNGGQVLPNYRVTYSATKQTRDALIRRLTLEGAAVTVVFPIKKHEVPNSHLGISVVDGDATDIRYDDAGVVVGLAAKGKLKGKVNHPLVRNV